MAASRPSVRLCVLAAALALGALPAAATTLEESYITPDGKELGLVFDDGIGLSGQAIFYLRGPGTIEILLTNTSTEIPAVAWFDNPADQVLTSLYLDLGEPGRNEADPKVTGGQAFVGAGSTGVGKKNDLSAGDALDAFWGFGTVDPDEQDLAGLPPDVLSTLRGSVAPFDGSRKLKGKGADYGAISALNLDGGHDGKLIAVSDTIRLVLSLDRDLSTLAGLAGAGACTPVIEFGMDREFFVADAPPPIIPEPLTAAAVLMGLAGVAPAALRRWRRGDRHAMN